VAAPGVDTLHGRGALWAMQLAFDDAIDASTTMAELHTPEESGDDHKE